ncbi:uncharacterized protein LOC143435124 [Arvicanthis niloticus]|uniref:uncharacterized protein LOC143309500 n=1 Tax=Arvicanthis niloticus TaxID=61156 RepID=UPI00402B7015
MDKTKKMMQFSPSLVKETSDSEEQALPSSRVFPALSTQCSKSEPLCFGRGPSHCSKDGWIVDWDLYLDYVRYYHKLNCAKKRGTKIFQSESHMEPQVSPGDVNKDKDTEEPEPHSSNLFREKSQEHETCDGGDCPDKDPASDSPRCQGCWAWLQRAFGQKKKKKKK